MACYGMSYLWEHRREGRNDSAVFFACMEGNKRQDREKEEKEEEGLTKEDPVACDSGGGKHKVFS